MKKIFFILFALIAVMGISAQDFVIGNGDEIQSLDPAHMQGVPEQKVFLALGEGLVVNDPKTCHAVPGIAESWKVSPDGSVYTFKLRKSTWSDGVPVTAQTFVDSWLRNLDPDTASEYAYLIGIVVKGAKIHITSAATANEIIVVPTRQMREDESDYAVSFAIPANTKGITFICRSGRGAWSDHEFHADHPVRELTEAMIVFDNVFVPWERVFMCGEWQFSMLMAYTFATFHRFTAISYKVPAVEVMAGCAVAMAKYNGLYNVGHIKDKLADIAAYVETLRALANAAAQNPIMYGDIAVPNPLIANMAKLHFASKYHAFVELIQDIGGGILATAPDKKDWENPDIHDYLEHYLGGSERYSTLDRLKMIHETMRHVCSHESAFHEVTTVHAEGSMSAQKMMILVESPLKRYETMAKAAAGIIPRGSNF